MPPCAPGSVGLAGPACGPGVHPRPTAAGSVGLRLLRRYPHGRRPRSPVARQARHRIRVVDRYGAQRRLQGRPSSQRARARCRCGCSRRHRRRLRRARSGCPKSWPTRYVVSDVVFAGAPASATTTSTNQGVDRRGQGRRTASPPSAIRCCARFRTTAPATCWHSTTTPSSATSISRRRRRRPGDGRARRPSAVGRRGIGSAMARTACRGRRRHPHLGARQPRGRPARRRGRSGWRPRASCCRCGAH